MTLTQWEPAFEWVDADAVTYADVHVTDAPAVTYRARQWSSPTVESAFPATEFIPSWNASTPPGSWLLVEAQLESDLGWSPWLTFARWADALPDHGGAIVRTSVSGQQDEAGEVAADVYLPASEHPFTAWRLRLTALAPETNGTVGQPRPHEDGTVWPYVTLVSAAVAAIAIDADEPTSEPRAARGVELAVPTHSQRLHADSFPHWDGGGQSWCSPTSTTMLLGHWNLAPGADDVAWVGHDTDPAVVHAVSRVFDQSYGGAGNWAFNTAYAATRGLRAYVTRLRDLTEVERFVDAGIPLVVSVSFTSDQLDGAGYDTNGHLLTVVGFTAEGDVISNDPNSHTVASNEQVRTVYRRDQFEKVWLGRNGGLAYVMHPPEAPLPTPPAEANWG